MPKGKRFRGSLRKTACQRPCGPQRVRQEIRPYLAIRAQSVAAGSHLRGEATTPGVSPEIFPSHLGCRELRLGGDELLRFH